MQISDHRLDWLENKSFKTEDAIAIAKFHSSRDSREADEIHDTDKTDESLVTHGKRSYSISEVEPIPEKIQKYSDSQVTKPHKSDHKHKKHKHYSKYSSDSEDSQRKYHHGHKHRKKKSKHRKHKHESSQSHRSKDRDRKSKSSSSSSDEEKQYKDDSKLESR